MQNAIVQIFGKTYVQAIVRLSILTLNSQEIGRACAFYTIKAYASAASLTYSAEGCNLEHLRET